MPNTNYPRGYGDLKYYWRLHCIKMKAKGDTPVTYPAFINRLKKMELKDAIEYPRVESQVRHRMYNRTPIQDNIRRLQTLKENNVKILDLDELERIEHKNAKKQTKQTKTEKTEEIRPKQSLLDRFISLFR